MAKKIRVDVTSFRDIEKSNFTNQHRTSKYFDNEQKALDYADDVRHHAVKFGKYPEGLKTTPKTTGLGVFIVDEKAMKIIGDGKWAAIPKKNQSSNRR